MTCDDRRDQMLLYVVGALDDDERQSLEQHLQTGCPQCAGALAEARAIIKHLPLALDPVDPPPRTKGRLMERIRQDGEEGRGTGQPSDRTPSPARSHAATPSASSSHADHAQGATQALRAAGGAAEANGPSSPSASAGATLLAAPAAAERQLPKTSGTRLAGRESGDPARDRLMKMTEVEVAPRKQVVEGSAGRLWLWPSLAAVFVIGSLVLMGAMFLELQQHNRTIAGLQGQVEEMESIVGVEEDEDVLVESLNWTMDLVSLITSPATRIVSLRADGDTDRWGRLLMDLDQNVCHIIFDTLDPPDDDRLYRLYLMDEEDQRVFARRVDINDKGKAVVHLDLPEEHARIARAVVSYDSAEGGDRPERPILKGMLTY